MRGWGAQESIRVCGTFGLPSIFLLSQHLIRDILNFKTVSYRKQKQKLHSTRYVEQYTLIISLICADDSA